MQRTKPRALNYVACYGLFLLLVALGYAVFLTWRRTALMIVFAVVGVNDSTSIIYGAIMLLIILALFGLVMLAEPYLRTGVQRQQLAGRFVTLALPTAGAIAFGLALQELITVVLHITE